MVKRQAFMKKSKQQKRQNAQFSGGVSSAIPMVTRSMNVGMPYKLQTRLKFARSYEIAHTGALQKYLWGANSPDMPSRTLNTSETPLYWESLMDIYKMAYVLQSRIRVTVTNITIADGVDCVLTTAATATTSSVMLELASRVGAQSAQLGHYQGGNAIARFSGSFNPNVVFGTPPYATGNVMVGLTDPPNLYHYLVAVQSTGGGTGNYGIHVEIEYDVVFEELA